MVNFCFYRIEQFGIAEFWRLPHLKAELGTTPLAARGLVERALQAAGPFVRPGLDLRAASLSLIGLLFVSVVWPARGWMEMSEDEWQATARQAVDVLLCRPSLQIAPEPVDETLQSVQSMARAADIGEGV